MSLKTKVQTMLEATLEATVMAVAKKIYEEKFGEPLKQYVDQYSIKNIMEKHCIKVLEEIFKNDEEINSLIKTRLREAIQDTFSKGKENA